MKCAVVSALIATAVAMCDHGASLNPQAGGKATVATLGYNDLEGPLNWLGLNESYANCVTGKHQSPINLVPSDLVKTVKGSTITAKINN